MNPCFSRRYKNSGLVTRFHQTLVFTWFGYCILYTVYCILYIVHCTLYIVHCTLYIVQFVWCELYKACFNVCSLKCAVCNGLLGQDIPKRRSTNLSLYPGQSSLPSFYLLDFKSAPTKRIEPFSILPICLHWVRWWGHFQNNQTFYNTIYLPAK